MKQIFVSAVFLFLSALPLVSQARPELKHQLDLDMTSREYKALLEAQANWTDVARTKNRAVISQKESAAKSTLLNFDENIQLDQWIAVGARNLEWIDHLNKFRSEEQKLSFTSEATQTGSPVSNPRIYNFRIISDQWKVLTALMPTPIRQVLFDNADLTESLPISERAFIEWGMQIDKLYGITARYKMMKPYQEEMAGYKAYDVRGYLNLNEEANLDQLLGSWSSLPDSKRAYLTRNLILICLNNLQTANYCNIELDRAVKNSGLVAYKNRYWFKAEDNYLSFFRIKQFRIDVSWDLKNNVMRIPFTDPENEKVKDFLAFNIEEEFSWANWQLKLDFVNDKSEDTTHVIFKAGVTPHVNGLAGSEITMDANAPLSEYDVQWTIRHEYGHVLGLDDCYIEFYDNDIEAFVSYQMDVTNLMCSRRGHFQQIHLDELERVYRK